MQSEQIMALVEGAIKRNDSLILAAIEVSGKLGCSPGTAFELVQDAYKGMEPVEPTEEVEETNCGFLPHNCCCDECGFPIEEGTEPTEPTEVAAKQAPGEPAVACYDGVPLTKVERFRILTERLADTYRRKNADYGDSFGRSVQRYGIIAALTRMSDKWNRLENLILNGGESLVGDESVLDTLMDLAAYALMTFIEVEEKDS